MNNVLIVLSTLFNNNFKINQYSKYFKTIDMSSIFGILVGFFGDDWGYKCNDCGRVIDFCRCKRSNWFEI